LRGDKHLATGEAHAAIRCKQQNVRWVVGGLPKQFSGARIQGENTIMWGGKIHDTVPDDWRSFLFAVIGNIRSPRHADRTDVGLVDLTERSVAVPAQLAVSALVFMRLASPVPNKRSAFIMAKGSRPKSEQVRLSEPVYNRLAKLKRELAVSLAQCDGHKTAFYTLTFSETISLIMDLVGDKLSFKAEGRGTVLLH